MISFEGATPLAAFTGIERNGSCILDIVTEPWAEVVRPMLSGMSAGEAPDVGRPRHPLPALEASDGRRTSSCSSTWSTSSPSRSSRITSSTTSPGRGAAETAFLLVAVYWAWNYTTWMANWFDPEVPAVRLALVFVMLASLLMAVAIPEAFGDHAMLFAASYCAADRAQRLRRRRHPCWSVQPQLPADLDVEHPVRAAVDRRGAGRRWRPLGAVVDGVGHRPGGSADAVLAPARGPTPMTEWEIDAGHFAERFQLFVIIVLGESIVLTGATATDVGLTSSVVVALGVAFLSSVALWWLYFGREATSAVRRMAADEAPGRVGRDAYTYLHLPIVAGILLTAVGDELVIAHPDDELGTAGALAALGGPALYLLGLVAFSTRVGRPQPWTRTAAAVALARLRAAGRRGRGLLVAAAATDSNPATACRRGCSARRPATTEEAGHRLTLYDDALE